MIPYIPPLEFDLGPLHISAFGILMIAAVVVGSVAIQWRGASQGLDVSRIDKLVASTVAGGFIISHVVAVLFYHPEQLANDPLALFKIWGAMTSYGGFIGAISGILLYVGLALRPFERWRYADAVAWGFPFGWIFGRLGCTLTLDHPGPTTDFALAFQQADGTSVHNLGFYELLLMLAICTLFLILKARPRFSGFWMCLLWLIYSPFRFGMDVFRALDMRYAGLTPGQWAAVAMFLAAAGLMIRRARVADFEPWEKQESP